VFSRKGDRGKLLDVSREADVGRRISELRTKAGLSQDELGRRCGLTFRGIQNIELTGETTVSRLWRIADALRVEISTLFAKPTMPKRKRGRPKVPKAQR